MRTNKTDMHVTYWQLIGDYTEGNGLRFKDHNFSKTDITDFVVFCMNFLKERTAQNIVIHVLSMVDSYKEEEL